MIWFVALIGLCFGSFANVIIYRLPQGKSIVSPPSSCQSCNTGLKWYDLLPVISWLVLRGKCRYCNTKLTARYPVTEVMCAMIFTIIAMRFGADIYVLPLWCLAFVLLCVAWIDWDTMRIPGSLLIIAAIAGICWVLLLPFITWQDAIIGVLAGALPLLLIDCLVQLIAKKLGFGYGDVKLMAVAGLFLGWYGIYIAYMAAFIAGGAFAVYLLATKKAERGSYLPFGPFLCFGVLLSLIIR